MAVVEPTNGDPSNPDDETDRFALTVCTKDSVRRFSPPTPYGGVFSRDSLFRDVLVKKRTFVLRESPSRCRWP